MRSHVFPAGVKATLVGALSIAAAYAQSPYQWVDVTPAVQPPLGNASLAYDVAHGATLFFGGYSSGYLRETWTWHGGVWTQHTPPHAPPQCGLLYYDTVRARPTLCGYDQKQIWHWDGVDWGNVSPSVFPPDGQRFALAFDGNRDRLVLFSSDVAGAYGDTWEWDGAQWLQRWPATTPMVRYWPAMAFDPVRGRTVMFGGLTPSYAFKFGDTWEWDGTDWLQRFPAHSPIPRFAHSMVWDPDRARVVLCAGGADVGDLNDTWEWDGVDWTQRATSNNPPARSFQQVAYDTARHRLVMFGGGGYFVHHDTWEQMAPSMVPASYSPYGTGCAGWAGTPWLTANSGRPMPGQVFRVFLHNLPPDHSTLMGLGWSNTTWLGLGLPLDLGPIGAPGCSLLMSPDLLFPIFNWAGYATWDLAIPNQPALAGFAFYNQGVAVDHSNALGLVFTNGGAGVIGNQ